MSTRSSRQNDSADFRRGQWVTVRGLDEILATLDGDAKLEGLPFMPEMVPSCGETFRVHRRADRTCVEGVGMRSVKNTVFLEGLRCDGSAHGGCQRGCLFFWKEAWLKPATKSTAANETAPASPSFTLPTMKSDRFCCQSTELAGAASELPPGRLRYILHDLRIGEMSLRHFAYLAWRSLLNRGSRLVYGRPLYEVSGEQKKTVSAGLDLQAGELVEVKSFAEIKATLDSQGRNRGLSFEREMALYCGRRYRVATPIQTIIVEATGKTAQLTDTVILEGIVCRGICAMNCPRAHHLFWRDIWLMRVEG